MDKIKMIYFYIFLVLLVGCSSGRRISDSERIVILQQSYNKNDYLKFLQYFPDTFDSFVNIYGYIENDSDTFFSFLYDNAYNHIAYLFENNDMVDVNLFLEKIFSITQHSYWQADAYTYLTINIENLFYKKYGNMIYFLNSRNNKELEEFWFFMLNGPNPINNKYSRFIIKLQEDKQERQVKIIKDVIIRLKKQDEQ